MCEIKLCGPCWSTYVRTVRLALIEKDLNYEQIDVNFASGEMPAAQLQRHPFAKVPTLQHGDFQLYKTVAISRYIDSAFNGPPLQPLSAQALARMTRVIANPRSP